MYVRKGLSWGGVSIGSYRHAGALVEDGFVEARREVFVFIEIEPIPISKELSISLCRTYQT